MYTCYSTARKWGWSSIYFYDLACMYLHHLGFCTTAYAFARAVLLWVRARTSLSTTHAHILHACSGLNVTTIVHPTIAHCHFMDHFIRTIPRFVGDYDKICPRFNDLDMSTNALW